MENPPSSIYYRKNKMSSNKHKKTSLINLIFSYASTLLFFILIAFNIQNKTNEPEVVIAELNETTINQELKSEDKNTVIEDAVERVTYVDDTTPNRTVIRKVDSESAYTTVVGDNIGASDGFIYKDRLDGVIVDGDGISENYSVESHTNHEFKNIKTNIDEHNIGLMSRHDVYSHNNGARLNNNVGIRNDIKDDEVDFSLLDRRLSEFEINEKHKADNNPFSVDKKGDKANDSFKNLVPVSRNDDTELGDITSFNSKGSSYGVGKGGELYAYNFPSKGVGAGIGSSAIGAGAGGGAGLSAGIGEGLLNGESVPTLGGIGDGAKTAYGEPAEAAGVGGLLGGAGAGGAAGLSQGYITEKLGLGIGVGSGAGNGGGSTRGYNYKHLPKDGALHIMMHVDGSGSILKTRKQLEIMKNSLLKTALLPYYNNDESLYNRRVTIVDGSGERTLKFFAEAAKKDNVLAVVFQDEAQPAYHLPNFNKKPEDHYLDDLGNLKASLNGHNGIYRGVMFQVDRGKTFAKSFKEFVGNSFRGEGYLDSANLKKYHKDNNSNNIKNKSGIVFNDEYHTKDSGDPEYYLNLIFNASKKVGLDLNIYGAGLTDGKDVKSD
jgi:hypothetical protein